MNPRLAVTAAVAVILASLSLSSVIASAGWIATGIGAVIFVAGAGILTRLSRLASAITATLLVLIAVVPLLSRPGWADRIAGLVIVGITALSATGVRPLRAFAVLACYLASLLLYLNLTFAHGASFGKVIPSYSSLSELGQLWRAAFVEFRYAPPVPDLQAVSLVTAAGIGAVAIAVDILAVRLRRPAVAGLPLLLLFSVPVASNLKVFGVPEMLIFAASLAGYLALLSADGRERLRMWGRLVTFRHVQSPDETGSGPDTRDLAASGRRIGLAAVCLAIVIPVVLPSMHAHDVFGTTSDGNASGIGTAGVSPLLKMGSLLEGKPTQVLTYTTNAPNPSEQYLQVYALNYNARQNQWLQPSYTSDTAPVDCASAVTCPGVNLPYRPLGVEHTTPIAKVTTKIKVSKDDNGPAFLPMPYAPAHLDIHSPGAGWLETTDSLTVLNATVNMAGLSYTVQSNEPDPGKTSIPDEPAPASIRAQYGSYDGPGRVQLLAIARQHTAGAKTRLARAQDLQNWFLSDFSYSLKPGLPTTANWLLTFLTSDQKGFCSQFAQAFAVLARLIGIPSRIAIGYTGGAPVHKPGSTTWQVTTADAHAWPELYFTGEGWLRFEPTPSGSKGQPTAEVPAYAGGQSLNAGPSQAHNPAASPLGVPVTASPGKRSLLPLHNLQGPGDEGSAVTQVRHSHLWLVIVIPAALFLLIAWPALTRLLTKRRRWLTAASDAGVAHAAWRELTDDLADYGVGFALAETPRALARRVAREAHLDEPAIQAVRRISAAEERARYARLADPGAGLKADVVTARRAISASVPRRQRLRARLLPASTLLAARQLAQRAGGMLSWLDSSWPTMRRQLRAAVHRPAVHRPG
jgi:TgpA N-terminal domain/Transglutaminase-like superfamily